MAFTEDEDHVGEPVRLEVGDSVAPAASSSSSSNSKSWFPGGRFHPVTMEDAEQFGAEMTNEIVRDYEKQLNKFAEIYLNDIIKALRGCRNPFEGCYYEQPISDHQVLTAYTSLMPVLAKMNISVCLSHEKSTGRVYRIKIVRK